MPPEQTANSTGHGSTIVQMVGDGNSVVLGHPYLALTRFESQRSIRHALNKLSPYSRSTTLLGRSDELASLRTFLASSKPISVRVVVGGGGSGKTRLALELCDQMHAEGWHTGFVSSTEADRFFSSQNLGAWGWQNPTLVVMDYAAAKAQALGPWLDELADRTVPSPHPLRILLLERSADKDTGWWANVFGGGWKALGKLEMLDPADPVPIRPLGSQQDRLALLHNMLALASPGKPTTLPVDDPAFNQRLMQLSWGGDPLHLMMAAVAMAQLGQTQALTLGRTGLAQFVATQEADRLKKMAKEHALPDALVWHLAACTTLAQGMAEADFIPFARDEQTATGWAHAPAALAELLHQAQPLPGGIAPITPDVIGEAFVLRHLRGDKGTATVQRCHARMGHRVAETVIRCVQDFGEASPEPLLWLTAIVQAVQQDATALARLNYRIPTDSLALRDMGLEVNQRRVALMAASSDSHPVQMAAALNDLSIAQSKMGQHGAAVQTAQEAVALYDTLVAQRLDVFLPGLAHSLSNLANRQCDLGQHKTALPTAQKFVDLCRILAAQRPDIFRPDLAISLTNLASMQGELGQHEDALPIAQEALNLYRHLETQRPDVFLPNLAACLNNLANIQRALKQHEAALLTTQEAVNLRRRLVAQQPDVFLPDLAGSLNNLAGMQVDLGQREAALLTAQEAVNLRRRLAAQRPDVFLPDLAGSLNNLASMQSALGQHEAALLTAQEAVDKYRRLAAQRPAVFPPDLARSLIVLALCTQEMRGAVGAWPLAYEAVQVLCPEFLQLPQAHGRLMRAMLREYLQLCRAANQAPDQELLGPLAPFFFPPPPE